MTSRGIYGDAESARAVLDAIGGAPVPRVATLPVFAPQPAPVIVSRQARHAYRGRCGNCAHPEYQEKRDGKMVTIESSSGCPHEVADGYNPLKFCAECRDAYDRRNGIEPDDRPPSPRVVSKPCPLACSKAGRCAAATEKKGTNGWVHVTAHPDGAAACERLVEAARIAGTLADDGARR